MESTIPTAQTSAPQASIPQMSAAPQADSQYATSQGTSLAGISGPGSTNANVTRLRPRQPQASAPSGQPMAAGVPGAERKFEYKQPLPGPGVTLGIPSDANTPGSYTSQLGFNAPGSSAASPVFGAADLLSPSFNPGAYATSASAASGRTGSGSGRKSGSGTGRVSKSNQRRKS